MVNSQFRVCVCLSCTGTRNFVDFIAAEYICEGPLLKTCGIDMTSVQDNSELWQDLAKTVTDDLNMDIDKLSKSER